VVWPATQMARQRHQWASEVLGLAGKRQIHSKSATDPAQEHSLYLVMAKTCVHVARILYRPSDLHVHRHKREPRRGHRIMDRSVPAEAQATDKLGVYISGVVAR
jgi:hypothetical protein